MADLYGFRPARLSLRYRQRLQALDETLACLHRDGHAISACLECYLRWATLRLREWARRKGWPVIWVDAICSPRLLDTYQREFRRASAIRLPLDPPAALPPLTLPTPTSHRPGGPLAPARLPQPDELLPTLADVSAPSDPILFKHHDGWVTRLSRSGQHYLDLQPGQAATRKETLMIDLTPTPELAAALDDYSQWRQLDAAAALIELASLGARSLGYTLPAPERADNPFTLFEDEAFGPLTPLVADELGDLIASHGEAEVCDALRIAALANARSLRYVRAVLERQRRRELHEQYAALHDERDEHGLLPAPDPAPDYTGSPEALAAWRTAYGDLQLQMPRETFDTWLRTARLLDYHDATFIVGVENTYARDWLQHRLKKVIVRTLRQIVGGDADVDVTFEVLPGANENGAGEVAPHPPRSHV
jgi:hypothetical protein